MDLPQAAALGRLDVIAQIVNTTPPDTDLLEIALIYASVQNQVDAAKYLIELGAKADVIPSSRHRGGGQATALHNAAWRGHQALVELLLDHGADANIHDLEWDGTPANWAEHGGHHELSVLLRSRENQAAT
jgi:ankyrin repeat protein